MSNEGQGGKKLSVARELRLVATRLEALRLVAEQKVDGAHHAERLPEFAIVVAGALHALRDRIRLLEWILKNVADPAPILCEANQAKDAEDGPGIVPEWSQERQVQHLAGRYRVGYYRYALERLPAFRHNKPGNKIN